MSEKIINILSNITNPNSGNTFEKESRAIDFRLVKDEIVVEYNRDGIDKDGKLKIEDTIIESLASFFKEDKIMVKTFSSEKKPSTSPKESPANLKVGHGQLPAKRKVDGVKNIIAVASGKGGVGKSTISTNLALALSKAGSKVGLIDADIYGPSIPMMLGKRDAKVLANDNKKIVPIDAHGIKFVSFGLFIPEGDPVVWRGPMLGGVLNQFLFDVDWGELDFLIMDLPPGTGDVQLSITQATDISGAIIVTTPQDVAILDARKGLKMFEKVNTPVLGVIENMSYFKCGSCEEKHYLFGNGGGEKLAKELEVPFLGAVPFSHEVGQGGDTGAPYLTTHDESDFISSEYLKIAKKLRDEDNNEGGGFFSKIFRK